MIACYDLSTQLTTFDFYSWLVQVKARGATEIVFDTRFYGPMERKWSREELRRRFETIIAPGPALAGLPCREGVDGDRNLATCRMRGLVDFARLNSVPRLRSVKPPNRAHRYTVTLRRQTISDPFRNSNERAWRKFAEEIGALVIEDFEDDPIDLHDRIAIYAGAEMNLGVTCGPMTMLTLTEYPCMSFGWDYQRERKEAWGLVYGRPLPWARPHQMNYWERDSYQEIRSRFYEWRFGLAAAC